MKITVTGSLGNISKPLVKTLVGAGHEVTVVSSNPDKKKDIEAMGARAAIGSVADVAFITQAFSGADAVYTMTPPNFGASNPVQFSAETGRNYAAAIAAAGVKKVVNLSSIGAHLPSGTGPIAGLHAVENALNELEGVAVKHLRAGFFYINLLHDIPMIKNSGITGANYGAGDRMQLVHPSDIAAVAAAELQQPFAGKSYRYVVSDTSTPAEITSALGKAIGKPELPWITFTDEQAYSGMTGAGMPAPMAGLYVEMGAAVRKGLLSEDHDAQDPPIAGTTKLQDFAKEFAAVYNS